MRVFYQKYDYRKIRRPLKEAVTCAMTPYTDQCGELECLRYELNHLKEVLATVITMLPEERYTAILNSLGWESEEV